MNANEQFDFYNPDSMYYANSKHYIAQLEAMSRQQQAEIEELEKENTDLRYLIATKLEQQDGISLNSMAHPVTNTPEPSYEIDPDKLETIEIDLPSPEPVALVNNMCNDSIDWKVDPLKLEEGTPLYTHPVKEFFEDEPQAEELHEILQSNAELTDEEIKEAIKPIIFNQYMTAYKYGFEVAKAILRKAQEK